MIRASLLASATVTRRAGFFARSALIQSASAPSHVLLTLPAYLAVAFEAWSRKVLTDLTKHPGTESTWLARSAVSDLVAPARTPPSRRGCS